MRIEKIEIENFRGFKGKHAVSFHPNLNVFVGVSGSGKSSILDLIGLSNGMLMHEVTNNYNSPLPFLTLDINSESTFCKNTVHYSEGGIFSAKTNFNFQFSKELPLNKFQKDKYELITDFSLKYDLNEIKKSELKSDGEKKLDISNIKSFPIFRYFHVKRQFENSVEVSNIEFLPFQIKAYEGSFHALHNFERFSINFKTDEDKENRFKVRNRNIDYESPMLEPVRKALKVFLSNLNIESFTNIRIDDLKEFSHNIGDLSVDKNKETFNLNQLSNGEQTMILLAADIAQKLSYANPFSENTLQGKGIVLIDEIETHLHPEWQREVIPALTATFPNIQFFITTHSPQVLSNVPNENVIIIENFEFKKAPQTLGKDSNSILNDVFGVSERPKKYQKAFEELYDLIDNPDKVEEAKAKLRQMMEELGTDDAEIERAKMHFEFLTEKPI